MPVFRLGREPVFPPVELAEPEGILAVGGDLAPRRLLAAYGQGIFPWYEEGGPILWWSPDPRCVIFPKELRVSRRLERTIRQGRFETRFDHDFRAVIEACASTPREGEDGTWITPEMQAAYQRLHLMGHAHSMEAWRDGRLAGAIYGVRLGRSFFGESMFHHERDASKVALVALVRRLGAEGVRVVDCQMTSEHLLSLGAREITRSEFVELVRQGLED